MADSENIEWPCYQCGKTIEMRPVGNGYRGRCFDCLNQQWITQEQYVAPRDS